MAHPDRLVILLWLCLLRLYLLCSPAHGPACHAGGDGLMRLLPHFPLLYLSHEHRYHLGLGLGLGFGLG